LREGNTVLDVLNLGELINYHDLICTHVIFYFLLFGLQAFLQIEWQFDFGVNNFDFEITAQFQVSPIHSDDAIAFPLTQ
jgi:hypothetical protein